MLSKKCGMIGEGCVRNVLLTCKLTLKTCDVVPDADKLLALQCKCCNAIHPKTSHISLPCSTSQRWQSCRTLETGSPRSMALHTCVLVRWPLTGICIACLLPRYAPMSLKSLILSCNLRLKSFSMVIFESSAVKSSTCLSAKLPTLAVSWI